MSAPSDAVRDAVVAVVAESGVEGTSVRRVAARAGVSIGAVQHHFPTKDAMLAAAMHRVEELHADSLRRETDRLPDRSPAALLRAVLHSLVPGDDADERAASSLWLAFVARAAVHDATAEQHRRTWQGAEDGIARLVTACADPGAHVDPAGDVTDLDGLEPPAWARDVAAELLALVDGVSVAALVEPGRVPAERARRLVDRTLDRTLAGLASRRP